MCIRDRLKPYAAKKLVKALKEEIGLPIHLHTHDTSGNQVAALLMAAEAGVDIVDTAISSLASLTSQPSMNSLTAALQGQERDTGLPLQEMQKLTDYWADVRPYYEQFEADIKTPATDIYRYEIPGGQYTNLKPQVESLGLGHRFDEVKEMYRQVNEMLGGIIKVTPSSKMVGDMAIFMVQNNLTPENILTRGKRLNFPDSVVSYFKGMMGQPVWGFPEELQKIVLKGEEPITCRPGELLPPADFDKIAEEVSAFYKNPTKRDLLGWCLYPKVMREFLTHREDYGDITRMVSHVFFMGMQPNEVTEIVIEDGKTLMVKYIGRGEENPDGTIDLIFELNGERREVAIRDNNAKVEVESAPLADLNDKSQVGAGISGAISRITVQPGDEVKENQIVAIIEAMKMETNIVARMDGVVQQVLASSGEQVKAGQLLLTIA